MRAFRVKVGDKYDTYTYDACIEFLCEKALEAFLESGGGGEAAANYFSATVEVVPPEYSLSTDVPMDEQPSVTALNNARNNTRASLHKWLNHPNNHETILEDHNADFVDNLKNFYDDNQRYDYLKKCVAPLWVRSIWRIPLAFHLCLRLGLIADLNWWCLDGAHSGFKTEIIEVWRNAIDDLHPFQHGPTHQGTKHCIQVHNNFCALKHFLDVNQPQDYKNIKDKGGIGDITADEWGLMSVAAALHDIGKADIIVALGDHAINGANAIRYTPHDKYKIQPGYKDFVAKIVDTHCPDGRYKIINNVASETYVIQGNQDTCSAERVKTICSLFHLADVMDTTRDRVSDPFLATLKTLYGCSSGDKGASFHYIEWLCNARKGMVALKIDKSDIKVYLSSDATLQANAIKRIGEENDDLKATGAWDTLSSRNLPKELFAVP